MNVVYVSLGSNIEPREQYLKDAIKKLTEHEEITVTKQSSIYETNPVDYTEQNDFLNMVLEIETSLGNVAFLEVCQQIEDELGRDRTIEKGPRTIDIDILIFNLENRDLQTLRIPHPRMHERAFVLVPLNEIAPDIVMPTSGKLVEDLLNDLPTREVEGVVLWEKSNAEQVE